ncbi:MAG: HIT family protein [Candidatus Polarisedimenticolia bacterium]
MTVPSCVFCAIVSGGTPALIVFEDADVVAFLDHRPLFPGHCLVAPRAHHETLADLPVKLRDPFFAAVQNLSEAVPRGMQAEGSFVGINNRVSQSVPHLHAHVVPRRRGDGLRGFFWPRRKYADETAMVEARDRIRAALSHH